MPLSRRMAAELLGTLVLVLGGCGSAVLAARALDATGRDSGLGIGLTGVSLAFGLTIVAMAFAVAPVSGAHLNPAVSVGLAVGGRCAWRDVPAYVVAQVAGAAVGAGVVWVVALGRPGTTADLLRDGGFATNGWGEHSPGGFGFGAAVVAEVVLTAVFLVVIMGVTDVRAAKGFAPLAIGLTLTLIHLVSIPVTNTSVNPARSTGPALLVGGDALAQLWLFWLAPLLGGVLGSVLYRVVTPVDEAGEVGARSDTSPAEDEAPAPHRLQHEARPDRR